MSKYDKLWEYICGRAEASLILGFADIASVAGVPIDHSFLQYKKELSAYGYEVSKISMKEQTVCFQKLHKE